MKRTLATAIFTVIAASAALAYQEPVPVTQEPVPTPQESAPATLPPAPSEPETAPPAPEPVAPVSESVVIPTPASELTVAGRVVMRVRTGAGGQTAEQRISNLQQRIGPILILPELKASDFEIRQVRPGETATIYVRGLLLVTVDPDLAQTNNTSVEGLAGRWVQNLRAVLPLVEVAAVKPATTATAAAASQPPLAEPVPAPSPVPEPTPSAEPVPAPSTPPATP